VVVEVQGSSVFFETVRYVVVFCLSFDLLGFLHHYSVCVELPDLIDSISERVVQGKYHCWRLARCIYHCGGRCIVLRSQEF